MQILKVFYCQKKMKNKIQISLIQTNIKKKKKKKKKKRTVMVKNHCGVRIKLLSHLSDI